MGTVITNNGLMVGQWVKFRTQEFSDQNLQPNNVFHRNQRFLVITRQDLLWDPCNCYLMNLEEKIFKYSPNDLMFGDNILPLSYEIVWVSNNDVENIKGKDRVNAINNKAREIINKIPRNTYQSLQLLGQEMPLQQNSQELFTRVAMNEMKEGKNNALPIALGILNTYNRQIEGGCNIL